MYNNHFGFASVENCLEKKIPIFFRHNISIHYFKHNKTAVGNSTILVINGLI